jgi:predicted nucleotide-binding protein (sugar kinase/HSP70/actin superfamily)
MAYFHLSVDPISYRLDLYPTSELENSYRSDFPTKACAGVVVIIVVTWIVFVIYDFFIQTEVSFFKHMAQNSSIVLNSFFPKFVQRELFRSKIERPKNEISESVSKLKNFLLSPSKRRRKSVIFVLFLN